MTEGAGRSARYRATLELAGRSAFSVIATDDPAARVVARAAEAMRLGTGDDSGTHLYVSARARGTAIARQVFAWSDASAHCTVDHPDSPVLMACQLMRVGSAIGVLVERSGGLLLHGALVERDGQGVILAGAGGTGKTTACRRLVRPWRCLSDDANLVARDGLGAYWAHPWPTWSKLTSGERTGSWDVQRAVPLRGVFFLAQAREDRVEPIGPAQATCLLAESAEQLSAGIIGRMSRPAGRAHRLQRLDTISGLAKAMDHYRLHLSRAGRFWQEIERVMERERDASRPTTATYGSVCTNLTEAGR
jgi:SynChlorMet cassette protein ScmC